MNCLKTRMPNGLFGYIFSITCTNDKLPVYMNDTCLYKPVYTATAL